MAKLTTRRPFAAAKPATSLFSAAVAVAPPSEAVVAAVLQFGDVREEHEDGLVTLRFTASRLEREDMVLVLGRGARPRPRRQHRLERGGGRDCAGYRPRAAARRSRKPGAGQPLRRRPQARPAASLLAPSCGGLSGSLGFSGGEAGRVGHVC